MSLVMCVWISVSVCVLILLPILLFYFFLFFFFLFLFLFFFFFFFFFSSRRRHTRFDCDWSSDVCSSDLCWTIPSSPRLRHAAVMSLRTLKSIETSWREPSGRMTPPWLVPVWTLIFEIGFPLHFSR